MNKEQLKRQCIKRMLMPNDISKVVLFFHQIRVQDAHLKTILLMEELFKI